MALELTSKCLRHETKTSKLRSLRILGSGSIDRVWGLGRGFCDTGDVGFGVLGA